MVKFMVPMPFYVQNLSGIFMPFAKLYLCDIIQDFNFMLDVMFSCVYTAPIILNRGIPIE